MDTLKKVMKIIFTSTDKNKEALENYREIWDEIKYQIKMIRDNKPIEYGKDFMKIDLESDDDLPLGKILSIPVCITSVGSGFLRKQQLFSRS